MVYWQKVKISAKLRYVEKSARVETLQKLKSIKTISDLKNELEKVLSPADFNLFQIEAQNILNTQIQYEVESSQVVYVRVGSQYVPVRFDEQSSKGFTQNYSSTASIFYQFSPCHRASHGRGCLALSFKCW